MQTWSPGPQEVLKANPRSFMGVVCIEMITLRILLRKRNFPRFSADLLVPADVELMILSVEA